MPVNYSVPDPARLAPVPGVELGIAAAGIRKPGRKDLLVMRLAEGARVAGVFTQNRFCAAPVTLCRQHLAMLDPGASVRAVAGGVPGHGGRRVAQSRRGLAVGTRA